MMNRKQSIRHFVQFFFFALIGLIAVNHTLVESGKGIPFVSDASLHAICPFGGVVTLYNLVTLGTFIQKIHMSSVILMALIFILAILVGPVFCSFVCPLGSFQEFLGKIGRKIFKKRYNRFIPQKIDNILKSFRYVALIAVVYITAKSGYLIFAEIDPYNALFSFWSEEVSTLSLIVLGATAALSLVIERPWCKYACPYGALLGLSNKFRIFKIKRIASTCISCNKCTAVCPMNIDVANKTIVSDLSCISCLACTSEEKCPVPETVTLSFAPLKAKSSLAISSQNEQGGQL